MSPEARVEAMFPELLPQFLEEQKMPQEDGHLGHSPPILRIYLLALLTQKPQIVPHEVALLTPHTKRELFF